MSETLLPTLSFIYGSPEFWMLYDEFCLPKNLNKLIRGQEFALLRQIHQINIAGHKSKEIHDLKRPSYGWKHVMCWLCLKNTMIQNHEGNYGMTMRAGDVIVIEHAWDRDVVITHTPIEKNIVSGYFLSGRWEPMIGLFLPLFDKKTIQYCINLRLERNLLEAKEEVRKASKEQGWYEEAWYGSHAK